MSYLKKYQWELVPENLPLVKRNCPKCNTKTNYINSEKFRINANKNNIDVWLIYKCENCKSTWNMTIYERIKPYSIDKYEYENFLTNDKELAREYGFNLAIFSKNKAEAILENINYRLIEKDLENHPISDTEFVVELICKYPVELRLDKLLSEMLKISRNKIKNMYNEGELLIEGDNNSLSSKVKDGMTIHVLKGNYTRDSILTD